MINQLPIELHLFAEKGENVPGGSFNDGQKYSFCGPGTKYEQRIREGYRGINELDSTCLLHDKFYNENIDTKTRNISDIALAHRADEIARNSAHDDVQRRDASFISGIMKTKARFGLGKSKTQKNLVWPFLKKHLEKGEENLVNNLNKLLRLSFKRGNF